MRATRLLTTSRNPGYVRELTSGGIRVDAIVRGSSEPSVAWDTARELSDSVRVIELSQASRGLHRGAYDVLVCHSVHELCALPTTDTPVVLVLHERKELLQLFSDGVEQWARSALARFETTTLVFSGADIAASWERTGAVIPPAIDVNEWSPSCGSARQALTVAPFAIERAALDAAYLVATLTAEVDLTVLGTNPSLGVDFNTASRPTRRHAFTNARVYVNVSSPAFESAAPMPMLEAMAAGLPVVTLAHRASPIVHGVNGLVARSAEELVRHTRRLLDEAQTARVLGDAARKTVQERYSPEIFAAHWRELLIRLPRPVRLSA